MAQWTITGMLDGKRREWKLEADDQRAAQKQAESMGIYVQSVMSDEMILAASSGLNQGSQRVIAIPSVQRCGNCDGPIGRLETPQIWREAIVCMDCYRRLSGALAPVAQHQAATPIHVTNTNINRNSRGCIGSVVDAGCFVIIAVIVILVVLFFIGVANLHH